MQVQRTCMPADHDAYLETLLRHRGYVIAVVRSVLRDDAAVEDVVQDSFLAALTTRPRELQALRPWLRMIARRRALNHLRARGRRLRREAGASPRQRTPSTSSQAAEEELHDVLQQALLSLPWRYAQPLRLRFREGWPPARIAADLRVHRLVRGQAVRGTVEAGGRGRTLVQLLPECGRTWSKAPLAGPYASSGRALERRVDPDGMFCFRHVAPGTYTCLVRSRGVDLWRGQVRVAADEALEINLVRCPVARPSETEPPAHGRAPLLLAATVASQAHR